MTHQSIVLIDRFRRCAGRWSSNYHRKGTESRPHNRPNWRSADWLRIDWRSSGGRVLSRRRPTQGRSPPSRRRSRCRSSSQLTWSFCQLSVCGVCDERSPKEMVHKEFRPWGVKNRTHRSVIILPDAKVNSHMSWMSLALNICISFLRNIFVISRYCTQQLITKVCTIIF